MRKKQRFVYLENLFQHHYLLLHQQLVISMMINHFHDARKPIELQNCVAQSLWEYDKPACIVDQEIGFGV
jgi:hypothetical protein